MNIQDVKINSTIEFDGKLWYVVEYQKVSRPRLAALFRTKLKNILKLIQLLNLNLTIQRLKNMAALL